MLNLRISRRRAQVFGRPRGDSVMVSIEDKDEQSTADGRALPGFISCRNTDISQHSTLCSESPD